MNKRKSNQPVRFHFQIDRRLQVVDVVVDVVVVAERKNISRESTVKSRSNVVDEHVVEEVDVVAFNVEIGQDKQPKSRSVFSPTINELIELVDDDVVDEVDVVVAVVDVVVAELSIESEVSQMKIGTIKRLTDACQWCQTSFDVQS